MSISFRIRILLIFGPPNPNTLKKLKSEYFFFNESIYGLESEYISFFAIEYEYNYSWRDMDLSPHTLSGQNQWTYTLKKYISVGKPTLWAVAGPYWQLASVLIA